MEKLERWHGKIGEVRIGKLKALVFLAYGFKMRSRLDQRRS